MKDHHKRSFGKTLSYRFSASLLTAIVVFVFTDNIMLSVGIGSADVIVKLIWYYLHERIWNHIGWGKSHA